MRDGKRVRKSLFSLLFCLASLMDQPPSLLAKEEVSMSWEQLLNEASKVERKSPAFAEAEGFGALTQGGRSGKLLKVNTLEDSEKEGSLRWAVNQKYPRIIEFAVEGLLSLNSNLYIKEPFITIDGSTAPGNGVTIKDGSLRVVNTHDVILRYLKVRPGDEVALKKGRWKKTKREGGAPEDAISVDESAYVIVDHCSTSWGSDELLSVKDSAYVTVQWCFITEPLANPKLHIENGKEISHPYCSLQSGKNISYIKNLFAYLKIRAPQVVGSELVSETNMEVVNSYVSRYTESGARIKVLNDGSKVHLQGNYYENPLLDRASPIEILPDLALQGPLKNYRIYLNDNVALKGNQEQRDWDIVDIDKLLDIKAAQATAPLFVSSSKPLPASQVKSTLFARGGAILPKRDPVDARIIKQLSKGRGELVNSQEEVGGYPKT